MRRKRLAGWLRPAVASTAVGAVLACATAPAEPRTAQEPPGCYQLTLDTWSTTHEAMDPPGFLALQNVVGTDAFEAGQKLVRPVVPNAAGSYPWMYWSAPHEDSLHLVFTGGYVGVSVHLARGAVAWKGRASAFSDIGGSATANAQLAPAVCPS